MKSITLCLLVLISASCLLSTNVKAYDAEVSDFEDIHAQLDMLLAELDYDNDYVAIDQQGFIRTCYNILKKGYSCIRGVTCIIKEVTAVLTACTDYVAAINRCGGNVPKDVLAIVDSCKQMITICNNILHANSTVCAADETDPDSTKPPTHTCILKLMCTTMKLVHKINTTLKQCAAFPIDTTTCFGSATNDVKNSCNAFLPNINVCIDNM